MEVEVMGRVFGVEWKNVTECLTCGDAGLEGDQAVHYQPWGFGNAYPFLNLSWPGFFADHLLL